LNVVDVYSGIKDNTEVTINTTDFEGSGEHEVYSIDATGIALDMLGRNIVNTIILGYFAKKTQAVSIEYTQMKNKYKSLRILLDAADLFGISF
jgi:pyruvate ferredoxin oxidoreductase gamma subunit